MLSMNALNTFPYTSLPPMHRRVSKFYLTCFYKETGQITLFAPQVPFF